MSQVDGKILMQIGDLAKLAGISVRSIRYYEELALIQPASHSRGGFRLYGEQCLKRLQVIHFLKEMGLSLTEIQRIFHAKRDAGGNGEAVNHLLEIFSEKLGLIDEKIKTLSRMRLEIGNTIHILHGCESCDHEVLLDALRCGQCSRLEPVESVPETFNVILQER
jgi:DNA-binding transcriptional MerR regulator